jgi:hypothetical protein
MSEGLITLVEVTAYDPAIPGTRVLRFTSGLGTMTRPTEVPPNVHFAPRLQQPIRFKRTMFSAARLAGGRPSATRWRWRRSGARSAAWGRPAPAPAPSE